MEIKAVFFDLDGTLFTPTRGVAVSTRRAIEELKKQGILVGIATGRGPSFCMPLLEDLSMDFAISYNGQYIFTPKEVIKSEPLDMDSLHKIVLYAMKNHRDISLGTAKGVTGSSLLKFGETKVAGLLAGMLPSGTSGLAKNMFKHIVRRFLPQSDFEELLKDPIYQIMMVATRSETAKLEAAFPELLITRSNPYSVDMIPKGVGKLPAIAQLGEIYGFTTDEVMAFGDSENDLNMLLGAGIGVAMGNATSSVKKQAKHVTETNAQDGIARALAYYGLVNFSANKSFVSKDDNFNMVKEFHRSMDGQTQEIPRAYTAREAAHRADFKIEEIVEFLYAAADNSDDKFTELTQKLHADIDKATDKIRAKNEKIENSLVDQTDALIDLLYLTYGSLVLAGIDPHEIFKIVHKANMGKIFPDGKAHFHPETHKVLKPADWEEKFAPEHRIKRELDRQQRVALKKATEN